MIKLPYPDRHFRAIETDPPWKYDDHHKGMNGYKDVKKYRLHPAYQVEDIMQIYAMGTEVNRVAAERCHLYLWTTKDFMEDALAMIKMWGWSMKTIIPWVKTYANGEPVTGPGYYFRGCVEYLIFAVNKTQGNRPICATTQKNLLWDEVPNVLVAENPPQHSAKPDLAYEMIRRQSPEPRLSIFQRTPREGFECWGDQMPVEGER